MCILESRDQVFKGGSVNRRVAIPEAIRDRAEKKHHI
jgi:hypothetical protein